MPRILRTLHAPASRHPENSERVDTYTSVTTRGKQREGCHLRPEFQGRSTRRRHNAPETTRGSPLTPRIFRMLHAPASRHAENNERGGHLRPEFQGRSTRQRHDARKSTRGSPLMSRISRRLRQPIDRPTDRLPSTQKERRAWLTRALQPRLG